MPEVELVTAHGHPIRVLRPERVNVKDLHPDLAKAVAAVTAELPFCAVVSAARTYAQQVSLRRHWCSLGKCRFAANPDYVNPRTGRKGSAHMVQGPEYADPSGAEPGSWAYACDFTIIWHDGYGSTAARRAKIKEVASRHGLYPNVSGEWWHFVLKPGVIGRLVGAVKADPGKRRTLRFRRPLMRGDDVRLIQQFAKVTADGVFGRQTEAAVKRLQAELKVTADGIVGPATWAALDRLVAYLKAKAAAKRRTLRLSTPYLRGDDVATVQKLTGSTVDGVFGHGTRNGVVAFQRKMSLTADGVVGPATWAALDNLASFLAGFAAKT